MPTVTLNTDDVNSLNASLSAIKLGSKGAIIAATNDSLSGIKTESARLIGAKVTAKAAVIKKHFGINKMTIKDMTAGIDCSGLPLYLDAYSTRQVNKGVSVQIFKKTKRYTLPHAFKATMRSGHTGVFWREDTRRGVKFSVGKRIKLPPPNLGSLLNKYQLPIKELYGPRIPDIFDDDDIIDTVLLHASKRFDDRLDYHTDRLLAKARGA